MASIIFMSLQTDLALKGKIAKSFHSASLSIFREAQMMNKPTICKGAQAFLSNYTTVHQRVNHNYAIRASARQTNTRRNALF